MGNTAGRLAPSACLWNSTNLFHDSLAAEYFQEQQNHLAARVFLELFSLLEVRVDFQIHILHIRILQNAELWLGFEAEFRSGGSS